MEVRTALLILLAIAIAFVGLEPLSLAADSPDFIFTPRYEVQSCDLGQCRIDTGHAYLQSGEFSFVPQPYDGSSYNVDVLVNGVPVTYIDGQTVVVSPHISIKYTALHKEIIDGFKVAQPKFEFFVDVEHGLEPSYNGRTVMSLHSQLNDPVIVNSDFIWSLDGGLFIQQVNDLYIRESNERRVSATFPAEIPLHVNSDELGVQRVRVVPFIEFTSSQDTFVINSNEELLIKVSVGAIVDGNIEPVGSDMGSVSISNGTFSLSRFIGNVVDFFHSIIQSLRSFT